MSKEKLLLGGAGGFGRMVAEQAMFESLRELLEIIQKSACGMNHRRLKLHYSLFKKSSRTRFHFSGYS